MISLFLIVFFVVVVVVVIERRTVERTGNQGRDMQQSKHLSHYITRTSTQLSKFNKFTQKVQFGSNFKLHLFQSVQAPTEHSPHQMCYLSKV